MIVFTAGLMGGCGPSQPPAPLPTPTPAPSASPTPLPKPTPVPTPYVPRKPMETGMMFNGLQYEWSVATQPGETAARDRKIDSAYRLELNLRIAEPRPATTLDDIRVVNERLPELLPSLPGLLESATVSPAFGKLYELKLEWLKARLDRLEQILSRHNYYDCDTVLQLRHPETGRRALLVQSEMDVNVDGSDGDRNVNVDGSGQFFQPQTSYRWPKKTERPNPFLAPLQEKLAAAQEELKKPGLSPSRMAELRDRIEHWKLQIRDIKRWSFLVSETDPFIVLPGFMLRGSGDFVPRFGDYAAVIHGDKIYPAILGDAGPSYKMGEGSLRLCKAINDTGTPLARPVSDLTVTYVVFPGSAEPERDAPNLDRWYQRCVELLAELGAPDAPVHRWENIVPPWPIPTPSPTPSPSPTPTDTNSQSNLDLTKTPAR